MSNLGLPELPEQYKWGLLLVGPTTVEIVLSDDSDHPVSIDQVSLASATSKYDMEVMVRRTAINMWTEWTRKIKVYGWAKELFG